MRTDVIDISHYQPTPNWSALRAAGVVGVILKCTEGQTYVDPTFRSRYDDALRSGLAVSSYHFLRPGSIETQLNSYLNTLRPRDGERVCLDHEDADVSLDDLRDAVSYLQSDSRNLQVAIYSGHVIEEQLGSEFDPLLASTSLWTAQYCSPGQLIWPKATWPNYSLWQFSESGAVAGVSGKVDCNEFNGSPDNCAKWLGPVATEPTPQPEPELETLIVDIPAGVPYIVKIDGVVALTNIET